MMLKSEEVLAFLYKPFSELFRKKRGGGGKTTTPSIVIGEMKKLFEFLLHGILTQT